jgi:hypothetical protein
VSIGNSCTDLNKSKLFAPIGLHPYPGSDLILESTGTAITICSESP